MNYSKSQLSKKSKRALQEMLDGKDIEYGEDSTKADLIGLIMESQRTKLDEYAGDDVWNMMPAVGGADYDNLPEREEGEPIIIAISGSAGWTDRVAIREYLAKLPEGSTVFAAGYYKGVDRIVKEEALALDMEFFEFPPAHQKHTRETHPDIPAEAFEARFSPRNYHLRNALMMKYAECFAIFGFKSNPVDATLASLVKHAREQDCTPRNAFLVVQEEAEEEEEAEPVVGYAELLAA